MLGIRKELRTSETAKSEPPRCRRALEKRLDHGVVLLGKHRTRGIQQFTTRRQEPPKRIEDACLPRHTCCDVGLATQPFDIRMTARDAGSGAGHISENSVVRHPVPPRPGFAAIRGVHLGSKPEPAQVVRQYRAARRIEIERGERYVGEFEYMRA